jgi:hypothetical protein
LLLVGPAKGAHYILIRVLPYLEYGTEIPRSQVDRSYELGAASPDETAVRRTTTSVSDVPPVPMPGPENEIVEE